MTPFSKVFRFVLLLALPVALLGAAAPQTVSPDNAAIIYNPGNGDFSGFRIMVERNGDAWATDAAGNEAGQLSPSLTQTLFADLEAVPLAQQPVRACPSSDPNVAGTSIWLNAGNRNASIQQPSSPVCALDPRITKLFDDAIAIEHALFVSAYRTRTPNGSTSNVVAGTTPAHGATSNAASGATSYAAPGGTIGSRAPSGFTAGTFSTRGYTGIAASALNSTHANTTYFVQNRGVEVSNLAPYTSYGLTGLSTYGSAPDTSAPAGLIGGTFSGTVKFGNLNQFQNPNFVNGFSNSNFRTSMGFSQGGNLNGSAFNSSGLRSSFSANAPGLSTGSLTSNGSLNGSIGNGQLGQ